MSETKKEGFSLIQVMTPFVTNGSWVYAVLGFLFTVLFNYGAARIAYGQTQSYFVSILAFFFSGLYYLYYALVVYTPPGVMSTVMGAARRMRR